METAWDHGHKHYQNHGMVSTIGYCLARTFLTIGSINQPVFPDLYADITEQALFVNGFLPAKQNMNKSKGGHRPLEEPKTIVEAPESYPGD
jgi:hypothetical protein